MRILVLREPKIYVDDVGIADVLSVVVVTSFLVFLPIYLTFDACWQGWQVPCRTFNFIAILGLPYWSCIVALHIEKWGCFDEK